MWTTLQLTLSLATVTPTTHLTHLTHSLTLHTTTTPTYSPSINKHLVTEGISKLLQSCRYSISLDTVNTHWILDKSKLYIASYIVIAKGVTASIVSKHLQTHPHTKDSSSLSRLTIKWSLFSVLQVVSFLLVFGFLAPLPVSGFGIIGEALQAFQCGCGCRFYNVGTCETRTKKECKVKEVQALSSELLAMLKSYDWCLKIGPNSLYHTEYTLVVRSERKLLLILTFPYVRKIC